MELPELIKKLESIYDKIGRPKDNVPLTMASYLLATCITKCHVLNGDSIDGSQNDYPTENPFGH